MKTNLKPLIVLGIFMLPLFSFSQNIEDIKLNPEKIKMFQPYVKFKHGGDDGFATWQANNKLQYTKEMWYYSESFYVKRNYLQEGITLNEEIVDISRFEGQRKQNEEAIVTFPGFRDVIVLIPANQLIYKP